jgi:dimethylaniline monooxygenase (N-oxide forming)
MRKFNMRRAAVIGAGAAGLSVAKHLLAKGMQVVVYELGSHIGGLWVFENDNGLSPAYQSLHLNSENQVTAYKDFPFPPDAPLYPDHRQVTQYLDSYADRFQLKPHIRFQSKVAKVGRTPDGGFVVELADGARENFDAVVVASGHQGVPKHPPFAKSFSGEYLHAHDYRIPEPFRGKRALVIGVGNSACDIAADICAVTAHTTMVARSPVLMMPRMFLGVPTARVLGKIEKPWMPWPMRRWIRNLISRMAHGRMEQWGFVTPTTRTHPAGHHLLMQQFIWNRVSAKPDIAAIEGRDVRFVDGSRGQYDVMIAATGYEVDLPFLDPELSPKRERWLDLYHRVVHPRCPGLYFVGFFNVTGGGNIRMMDDQAEWVAALEAGELGLPTADEMMRQIEQEQARVTQLYPDSPRYGLELDPREYRGALAKEIRRGATRARLARPELGPTHRRAAAARPPS